MKRKRMYEEPRQQMVEVGIVYDLLQVASPPDLPGAVISPMGTDSDINFN